MFVSFFIYKQIFKLIFCVLLFEALVLLGDSPMKHSLLLRIECHNYLYSLLKPIDINSVSTGQNQEGTHDEPSTFAVFTIFKNSFYQDIISIFVQQLFFCIGKVLMIKYCLRLVMIFHQLKLLIIFLNQLQLCSQSCSIIQLYRFPVQIKELKMFCCAFL